VKVASYRICIDELSAFESEIVVPAGFVQRNRTGVACVAVGVGLVTVYVIVSPRHGLKFPVRGEIAVGVGGKKSNKFAE
jgi:hypothetical protein